jgi:hypothetical protein
MARVSSLIPLVVVAVAGCSQPKLSPSFESGIPTERTMAAVEAAQKDDHSKIPQLITMLGSGDPAQRMIASDALERLTGQTLGYDYAAPEPERNQAIARWRSWQDTQRRAGASS